MIGVNSSIESRVYGKISAGTPSAVWAVGDFLDFGTRDAVSKALQRLEAAPSDKKMLSLLRQDYNAMSTMIFGEVPNFDAVLESIARAEERLNAT
jgi:hypothetical protein